MTVAEHDTSINAARDLVRRGWSPIPIPAGQKAPRIRGWQKLRLSEDDLPRYFNGQATNIGVLLGEPSGGLVDIDLDDEQARQLADDYLPRTGATFGRESAPRSHRLYYCPELKTEKHKASDNSMIVELRSDGCQTLAPGSTHPTGEPVRWDEDGEPATVDADVLIEAVKRLSEAVRGEAGETDTPAVGALDEGEKNALERYGTSTNGDGYAEAALRSEVETVAATERGGRNDQLNRSAFNVGQLIGGGALDRERAENELFGAAQTCGLVEDDGDGGSQAQRTIKSGISAGEQQPRQRQRMPDPQANGHKRGITTRAQRPAQRQWAVEVIKTWLWERYAPTYREGGLMFSKTLGGFLRPGDVVPDSVVIDRLAEATDAPRDDEGRAKRGRLPTLYATWARVAFGDVLTELPTEEAVSAPRQGRFPRLVARLLTSMVTLGNSVSDAEIKTERRSVIAWCAAFTQRASKWQTWQRLRSMDCWARRDGDGDNLQIAIRPALAHQVGGAAELSDHTLNKMGRLASVHGIGEAGKVNADAQQVRAVILDAGFINELAPPSDRVG